MKGTVLNFNKVREVTVEEWEPLSGYKKREYWDLHKEYPEEHLLDDVEFELELDDEKVELDAKRLRNAYHRRNKEIPMEQEKKADKKKSQSSESKKIVTKQEKELESSINDLEELKDIHLNEKGRLEKKIKNLKKELAIQSSNNELETLKLKLKVSGRGNEIFKMISEYESLDEECSDLYDDSEKLKEKNKKLEQDLEKMREKYHKALLKIRD
jgi:chromosome segregation ATPase